MSKPSTPTTPSSPVPDYQPTFGPKQVAAIEKNFEQLVSGLESKCNWKDDGNNITQFAQKLSAFERVSIISRLDATATPTTAFVKNLVGTRLRDVERFIEGAIYIKLMKDRSGVSITTRIMNTGEADITRQTKQLSTVVDLMPEIVMIDVRRCVEVVARLFSLIELFYVVCAERYYTEQTNEQLSSLENLFLRRP